MHWISILNLVVACLNAVMSVLIHSNVNQSSSG